MNDPGAGVVPGAGARADDRARILDRGYRHFDGPRAGLAQAMRSVGLLSIQRMLGLRRSFWAKLVPAITGFFAYVPAIVFVGLAILIPEELMADPDSSTYAGYYGFITAAILLFVSFVGPEVLCPDRRDGMLGLYLASPLDRDTYLVAKGAAVSLVLGIVTIGPALLLLLGNTIAGNGPDGPVDFFVLLLRVVVAGIVIATLYATLALAVSSVADRRAAASATIAILVIASGIVATALVEGAGASEYLGLLNLLAVPFEVVVRVYGERLDEGALADMDTAPIVAAYLAWTALFVAIIRFRYQRLDVTR